MHKRQQGVAIVEFALILPFLLMLTFITTEFGRAIWEYNTLTKSARDTARYLSLQTPGTQIAEARRLLVYGNLAGTGSPLVTGLTLANVSPAADDPYDCCIWQTAGANPVINTVTVQIRRYTFRSMFGSAFDVPFGNVMFPPIRATMRSYL